MRRCRICGCTDARACPGGCSWICEDVCSNCVLVAATNDLKVLQEEGGTIMIDVSAFAAFQIVAALQLALRHPKFDGETRETAREFAQFLTESLTALSPPIGALAEAGFNRENDVIDVDQPEVGSTHRAQGAGPTIVGPHGETLVP